MRTRRGRERIKREETGMEEAKIVHAIELLSWGEEEREIHGCGYGDGMGILHLAYYNGRLLADGRGHY